MLSFFQFREIMLKYYSLALETFSIILISPICLILTTFSFSPPKVHNCGRVFTEVNNSYNSIYEYELKKVQ